MSLQKYNSRQNASHHFFVLVSGLENPQKFLPCIFFKKPSFIHLAADKLCCDVSVYVVSIGSGYIMCHDMTNAAQHESPVVTALCS